jgi:phosphate uptake regulator
MTRKLYGMVVISETINEIVVEEHFEEIDIRILNRQLLSKIYLMINNYKELVEDLDKLDDPKGIIDELIQQDDQIDEHRYAVERYVHQILRHPSLGQIVNINAVECLHYSEMTRLIERIGDHIVKLAILLKMQEIVEKEFVLEQLDKMWNIYITIQDYFERTDSLKLWKLVQEIKAYASEVKDRIYENHPDTEYLIPIRRICNICGDIAEIRINDILSQTQSKIEKKKK